ncbi:hypothetical protein CQA66_08220 [Helicobacter aurati]|uniref:Uncharacterized protein n=1 Tax=Helicobacter aurati TaxID=137778 RepID=A0A3D8IZ90_9HELI|nr:hypothetical protein [Helicobacter aurati]RDU70383.1 hypothetical protein CQA66_08220 [Helicobacter aurati]
MKQLFYFAFGVLIMFFMLSNNLYSNPSYDLETMKIEKENRKSNDYANYFMCKYKKELNLSINSCETIKAAINAVKASEAIEKLLNNLSEKYINDNDTYALTPEVLIKRFNENDLNSLRILENRLDRAKKDFCLYHSRLNEKEREYLENSNLKYNNRLLYNEIGANDFCSDFEKKK